MAGDARPASADARLAALFPDPSTGDASPTRRRRRTAAVASALVVLVVVAVVVASAAFGSSGPDYRVATVGPQQVDSALTSVATIEPIAQATVAFPVAGMVASVNVKVGDTVAAGGVLASLDTQSLLDTLHTKQNALAQAQLTLSKALAGQAVGSVGSSGSSFGGSGSGASATTSAYRAGGSAPTIVLTAATITDPTLAADQQAVLSAQQQVDAAINAADVAIAAETTACSSFLGSSSSDPPPDASACQQAITAVQTAQQGLADAQHALATASSALDAYLGQLASAPPTTPPGSSGSGGSGGSGGNGGSAGNGAPSGDAGSSGDAGTGASSGGSGSFGATTGGSSRSGGSGGSGVSGPTAADLVAYQASVDAAADAVAAAQQAVDAATIASPLTGTVVGVNMKVGDTVAAGSSTENVVVQGQGGYEISTSVSVDDIPSVSIGQAATVLPDGSHAPLAGKVVGISVVPASSTSTTTAPLYHVIVGLSDPDAPLHDGATGTVSIVTKTSHAALAVPTSSLTTTGSRHTVTVVRNGSATTVPVQTGVIGTEWAEITSGLHAGDEVVLADASAALPGSVTASSGAATGLSNGTGAGGFGGFGGFGGLGAGGGARPVGGRG